MTPARARRTRSRRQGFTERQAGFLVTVMLHSGVCVRRQYCAYARIVHGQKDHDFFSSLVARSAATSYTAAHRRAPHLPCARQARSTPPFESRTTATVNPSRWPAPSNG